MASMTGQKEIFKFFRTVQDLINSQETMRILGGFTIRAIVERTRGQGKGVAQPGGQARKLKKVTPDYAEWRKKQKGKHAAASSGNASNLTLFGPLLSNLIIKRATKSDLRIGYQDPKLELQAEGQEKQGRRFLVLSGAESLAAKRFISEHVARRAP